MTQLDKKVLSQAKYMFIELYPIYKDYMLPVALGPEEPARLIMRRLFREYGREFNDELIWQKLIELFSE